MWIHGVTVCFALLLFFFFSSRRRHTRCYRDWSSDVCSSDLWGFTEAPRGALGHWVHIKDKKIANYQAVVPSTWNCSPRDAKGEPGPYESALIGTPIADEKMPLEVLRTIHSFDPCMACGVHLVDVNGNEINQVTF